MIARARACLGSAVSFVALGVATVLLGSCGEGESLAPPEVYFGEDACVACDMIVSDDRFAAAAIVRGERGYDGVVFDDIGCLLEYETGRGDAIAARYVADFSTREWLDVETATYVHSRALVSPMAFGTAALADRAKAAAVRKVHPGDELDVTALRARYAAGDLRVLPDFGNDADAGSSPIDDEGDGS